MSNPIPPEAVVVARGSYDSDDPEEIVASNVEFVNALFVEHLRPDEIARDALRSYYVDYYLAEVNNGGFSQFVYNSRWSEAAVALVREGLQAIGAKRHLALFEKGAQLVAGFGEARLKAYFQSEYFGENADRDELNAPDDEFFALAREEDLVALNAAWLRQLPHLAVLTFEEMNEEAHRRGQALPDREERVAAALANEPRYKKLIRALCARAGHQLDRVTAGDPSHVFEGTPTLAWHFLTDRGHHHMIDAGNKAIMFEGSSDKRVCEIDIIDEGPRSG